MRESALPSDSPKHGATSVLLEQPKRHLATSCFPPVMLPRSVCAIENRLMAHPRAHRQRGRGRACCPAFCAVGSTKNRRQRGAGAVRSTRGGSRTHTSFRTAVFETAASTVPPPGQEERKIGLREGPTTRLVRNAHGSRRSGSQHPLAGPPRYRTGGKWRVAVIWRGVGRETKNQSATRMRILEQVGCQSGRHGIVIDRHGKCPTLRWIHDLNRAVQATMLGRSVASSKLLAPLTLG